MKLDVDKVEVTQHLWEAGYYRAVASRVVVQFKQGRSHKLVVPRDREEGLLWEGH